MAAVVFGMAKLKSPSGRVLTTQVNLRVPDEIIQEINAVARAESPRSPDSRVYVRILHEWMLRRRQERAMADAAGFRAWVAGMADSELLPLMEQLAALRADKTIGKKQ